MKKLIFLLFLTLSLQSEAQQRIGNQEYIAGINKDRFIVVPVQLLVLFASMYFVIFIIRMFLNYRLRKHLVEKGISADLIGQLLKTDKNDLKNEAIRWFCLLISAGFGLIIVSLFPVGFVSIAILLISVAVGFLLYFFYLKNNS